MKPRENKSIMLISLTALAGCLGLGAPSQAGSPAYPVAVARAGTWSARTEAQGRVRASRRM